MWFAKAPRRIAVPKRLGRARNRYASAESRCNRCAWADLHRLRPSVALLERSRATQLLVTMVTVAGITVLSGAITAAVGSTCFGRAIRGHGGATFARGSSRCSKKGRETGTTWCRSFRSGRAGPGGRVPGPCTRPCNSFKASGWSRSMPRRAGKTYVLTKKGVKHVEDHAEDIGEPWKQVSQEPARAATR